MKQYVKEVLDYARDRDLDLSARLETVPIETIEVVEGVDPDVVKAIQGRFVSFDWPKDLPLVVVASNIGEGYRHEGYVLLDGHHRLAAAERIGASEIPALVVSLHTYEEIAGEFDIPRVNYIADVLAAVNPEVAANVKKGAGGSLKRRLT